MSNLFLIEEYLKDLEQDQMDVANASHVDPNSAEEGVPNPYEHNPHLQKYRAESAVANTDRSTFEKIIDPFISGLKDWDFEYLKKGGQLFLENEAKNFYDQNQAAAASIGLDPLTVMVKLLG